MKTFVFKSSLVILIVLMLASFFGGAPMNVAAAAVVLVWSPTTSPGSFDYGTLNFGNTSSQQFTLTDGRNSGALTASLSGSPAFSISNDGCTGTRLRSNESCVVTVQYAPTGSGASDTATLSASNRKGNSASLTLSGASATPCALQAAISPSSQELVPNTYTITASEVNGCGVPLHYVWLCSSDTNPSECNAFNDRANTGPQLLELHFYLFQQKLFHYHKLCHADSDHFLRVQASIYSIQCLDQLQ